LAPGVTLPPILRPASAFVVAQFALWPGGRVHEAELKAGFGAAPDYYAVDSSTQTSAIDPSRIVDVTAHVDEQGMLRWDAPEGSWRILRFGASLTGSTNGPASPEATGLEVDKLDGGKVRRYLTTYLSRFESASIDALLSDSIESGPQNFTDQLRDRFRELRGYDPLTWLPGLAGYVVGDASRTDRFLWDYRRTIADLLSSEYYGMIEDEAHTRGLMYYAEALEDHRPQLGDDLAIRSHADVPMGAMWLFDAGSKPAPTYVADLKGASSVAHVYGKPFTGAESRTAFHRPWSYTPRRLKHIADLELALGVTRFCIHTSPHQPLAAPPPGIALAPFLGQSFTITDELYCFPVFEDSVVPLMRTRFDTSDTSSFFGTDLALRGRRNTNEGWTHPPGSALVGWVKHAGRSPLVYLQFGDGPVTYADPVFRRVVANAIRWAASPDARRWAAARSEAAA
jgi:hypothetical protein